MTIFVRDSGAWKESTPYVRDGGVWKEPQEVYARSGGTWKKCYPDPVLLTTLFGCSAAANIWGGSWSNLSNVTYLNTSSAASVSHSTIYSNTFSTYYNNNSSIPSAKSVERFRVVVRGRGSRSSSGKFLLTFDGWDIGHSSLLDVHQTGYITTTYETYYGDWISAPSNFTTSTIKSISPGDNVVYIDPPADRSMTFYVLYVGLEIEYWDS